MSFPVALQSALFYFLSCTPCSKVRHRQKARDKAKKDRLEKAARLETEQPGLYQHPAPFNTNPYWQEEIAMGPSLPKKPASKNSSSRGLTSAGRDSCNPSLSERTNVDDSRTNVDSMSVLREEDDTVPSDWNRKIGYQREDEELWGQWSTQKLREAINRARDSAGRLIESTLGLEKEVTDQQRRAFYTTPRNPPVNDYHPPIISSRPINRDGIKWMLQPPPPAKIMEGKVPVTRAASCGSKSSGRSLIPDDPFLDKIIREKLNEERYLKGSMPTEKELVESLFTIPSNQTQTQTQTQAKTSTHSQSLSYESDLDDKVTEDSSFDDPGCCKPKARAVALPPSVSDDSLTSFEGDFHAMEAWVKPLSELEQEQLELAQRPRRETNSHTDAVPGAVRRKKPKRRGSRRSSVLGTVGSPAGGDAE